MHTKIQEKKTLNCELREKTWALRMNSTYMLKSHGFVFLLCSSHFNVFRPENLHTCTLCHEAEPPVGIFKFTPLNKTHGSPNGL